MANFTRCYVRQSSDERTQINSHQYQIDEIRAFYTEHPEYPPWQDTAPDINRSGAIPFAKRPNAAKLLAILEVGDVLIVHRLDRLARRMFGVLGLIDELVYDRKIKLVCVTRLLDFSTAHGRAAICLDALVAEFETEGTSVRTKSALARNRRNGYKNGGARRFGYDVEVAGHRELQDGTLREIKREIPNVMELEILAKMRTWSAAHTPDWIAERLNALGSVTVTGKAWTRDSVRRQLEKDA